MNFPIYETEARGILSKTTGFIQAAGFTHSLTPARNCTFGCSYCYVPTMGIYGGLKPDDVKKWGQFTTYKSNAAALLAKALKPDQRIYCSPVVDPYQPTEEQQQMMPRILDALIRKPPRVFTIQTRGTLILRDIDPIRELATRTRVNVSFSVTTDDNEIIRVYENRCAKFEERLSVLEALTAAGINTFATIAPMLPCNPRRLVEGVVKVTTGPIICDPFHVRETKSNGATTRDAARAIANHHGHQQWFEPAFHQRIIDEMKSIAPRPFEVGPKAFAWLAI